MLITELCFCLFLGQTSDKTQKQSRLKHCFEVLSEFCFEGRYSEVSSEARYFWVADRVIPRSDFYSVWPLVHCQGHAPVIIYITRHITCSRYVYMRIAFKIPPHMPIVLTHGICMREVAFVWIYIRCDAVMVLWCYGALSLYTITFLVTSCYTDENNRWYRIPPPFPCKHYISCLSKMRLSTFAQSWFTLWFIHGFHQSIDFFPWMFSFDSLRRAHGPLGVLPSRYFSKGRIHNICWHGSRTRQRAFLLACTLSEVLAANGRWNCLPFFRLHIGRALRSL